MRALEQTIRFLRPLGIKVAVITNGTLLWRDDVRAALNGADWVSVKVDAAEAAVWRRVNRPHPDLDFAVVRDGITRFAAAFGGRLVSETMLVSGLNDGVETVEAVGAYLSTIDLARGVSLDSDPSDSLCGHHRTG